MRRGSRLWLQFAEPATWRLAYDHDAQIAALTAHAQRSGRWWVFGLATTQEIS